MRKMNEDEQELKMAISALKIDYFKGSINKCSYCGRKGGFGSIITYECESGNKYILCGWCGSTTMMR